MKPILTLLWCVITFSAFAQTVTVSEAFSLRNDNGYQIIGKLKDRFLLFRDRSNSEYEIQAFDTKLRQSWNKQLEFEKRKTDVLSVINRRNDFVVVYRYRSKGDYYLKVSKYDAGANVKDTATVKIYESRFQAPRTQVEFSDDRSKIVLYHIERGATIEATSFDLKTMQVLWECSFAPEGLSFHSGFRQVVVNNKGDFFYILGRDNRKSAREDHRYEVFVGKAYQNTESVAFFSVPMQEKLSYDGEFVYDNLNDRLIAGGLYSEKNLGRATGYFYLNLNPNNYDSAELYFIRFSDELVSNYTGKKVENNKGVNETRVQEIVLRRDGGMLMILEKNRLYERQLTGVGRGFVGGERFLVDYHFEEMLALSIHPNGKLHWANVMHKRQYSQDDDAIYSSFFLLKTPSNLRVLFNDEIKSENTVSEYVINGEGESDRNSVMSTSNQKLRLRFRDAQQVGADELLVPSERSNRLKLVRVKY